MTVVMSTQASDPFLGKKILGGQFRIEKRIGSGGMGSVYRATETAMGRTVAIKILHPKLKGRADLVSRFRREARAMSQLQHPHTVRVFRYGELEGDGSLYFIMEHLEGRNLNQLVRREGPMEPRRAVPILVSACQALAEAHDLGIIHRDLKPENIFICQQAGMVDYAKLLDFGLAKVTEQQMQPGSLILTQEGMVFGTPEFMSPEQAHGHTTDARSDIYALACILYETLTGKLPFDAKSPMEFVNEHVSGKPSMLNRRVKGRVFPEALGAVISKALRKEPNERYQTTLEFAEALAPFRRMGLGLDGCQENPERKKKVVIGEGSPQAALEDTIELPGVYKKGGISLGSVSLIALGCVVLGGLGVFSVMKFLGN